MSQGSWLTRKQAQTGSFQLSWLEAGEAPETLVLLHGIGSNAQSWARQLAYFSAHYRVVAWDAPGYGNSAGLATKDTSPTAYAQALKALFTALAVQRAVLVGHSLGAIIAARFACLWPEAVEALVLSAPASGYGWHPGDVLPAGLQQRLDDITRLGPEGMAKARAARTLTPVANEDIIAKAQEAMASVSVKGYQDAVHLLAQGTLKADLLKLGIDFSVLCGTQDQTTPLSKVGPDTQLARRRELVLLEGAAHASYLEYPDLYNQELASLLAKSKNF